MKLRAVPEVALAKFDGRTVFITGASLGIGRSCAEQFHREGANVVLVARRLEPLQEVADALGTPDRVLVHAASVADLEAMHAALQAAVDRFGALHGVVNNAGLHHRGNVETRTPAELAAMVDVNLRAPIAVSTMALPHLRASATNRAKSFVVQVASLAGMLPLDGAATYSATKAGLRAWSFALAEELRDAPVTVSVVSPGPVDTGFIMSDIDEVSDLTFSQPVCSADHVAEMVLACAHDGKRERAWPASGATMGTLGSLFPGLRRALKPRLEARGRRNKAKLKAQRHG